MNFDTALSVAQAIARYGIPACVMVALQSNHTRWVVAVQLPSGQYSYASDPEAAFKAAGLQVVLDADHKPFDENQAAIATTAALHSQNSRPDLV